jgi:hypothetical protein
MLTKKFKTKSNDGTLVHIEVHLIESDNESESAVIIVTNRLISLSDADIFNELNKIFPIFFCVRETDKYALLVTKSAPLKLSTFEEVYKIVSEFKTK